MVEKFENLDLDARLLKAAAELKFNEPTLIQQQAIPLALLGKSIVARARTGSGKTAAYVLPMLHKLLNSKEVGATHCYCSLATRALMTGVCAFF